MTLSFCDWDRRPVIVLEPACLHSFVALVPGEGWSQVDAADLFRAAGVKSEADWRARFEPESGPVDISAFWRSGDLIRSWCGAAATSGQSALSVQKTPRKSSLRNAGKPPSIILAFCVQKTIDFSTLVWHSQPVTMGVR